MKHYFSVSILTPDDVSPIKIAYSQVKAKTKKKFCKTNIISYQRIVYVERMFILKI